MKFDSLPQDYLDAEKEKQRRRKVKESVGGSFPFTPMLDTKCGENGLKEYCDAILMVKDIYEWDKAALQHSENMNYSVISKDVSGGTQRTIKKGEVPYVTMTSYHAKKKVMIQPGNRSEANLLSWLQDLTHIKSLLHSASSSCLNASTLRSPVSDETGNPCSQEQDSLNNSTTDCDNTQPSTTHAMTPIPTGSAMMGSPISSNLGGVKKKKRTVKTVRKSKRVSMQRSQISGTKSAAKKIKSPHKPVKQKTRCSSAHSLICDSPASSTPATQVNPTPITPEGFAHVLVPLPTMPLGHSFQNKQFIINEVLCYIQNKMDSLTTHTIVKLGSDFFDYNSIIGIGLVLCQMQNFREIKSIMLATTFSWQPFCNISTPYLNLLRYTHLH